MQVVENDVGLPEILWSTRDLVSLVHQVDLVSLVGLLQPHKQDRPNRRDRPNEQDRLAEGGCLAEKIEAFRCMCSLGTQTGVTWRASAGRRGASERM